MGAGAFGRAELWEREPATNRELIEQAYAVLETEPPAAFQLYLEAAEAGSPGGMEMVRPTTIAGSRSRPISRGRLSRARGAFSGLLARFAVSPPRVTVSKWRR